MFQMISEIHRISNAYSYVPVITEVSGLIAIGTGVCLLGFSGILKIQEYYTGQKASIPYISNDAVQFNAEVGKDTLMHGVKRIAPTIGVLLTAHMLFGKY